MNLWVPPELELPASHTMNRRGSGINSLGLKLNLKVSRIHARRSDSIHELRFEPDWGLVQLAGVEVEFGGSKGEVGFNFLEPLKPKVKLNTTLWV